MSAILLSLAFLLVTIAWVGGSFATRREILWEPRYIWIGVFWDRREDGLHVYVCPVPCIVTHLVFAYSKEPSR